MYQQVVLLKEGFCQHTHFCGSLAHFHLSLNQEGRQFKCHCLSGANPPARGFIVCLVGCSSALRSLAAEGLYLMCPIQWLLSFQLVTKSLQSITNSLQSVTYSLQSVTNSLQSVTSSLQSVTNQTHSAADTENCHSSAVRTCAAQIIGPGFADIRQLVYSLPSQFQYLHGVTQVCLQMLRSLTVIALLQFKNTSTVQQTLTNLELHF